MGESQDTVLDVQAVGALFGIPALDPLTGHLPPGRYRTTLQEIHERFVLSPDFQASATRELIWVGFYTYLEAWRQSQLTLGQPILKNLWIGGSFTSRELDPDDIDISPIYDDEIVGDLAETPGIGRLKKLIGHRKAMVKQYRVEPFPMPWRSIASTLHATTLSEQDQNYLAKRGGLDDWWQRVRPDGDKVAPVKPIDVATRGYLEVIWS